jgi:UDPglucose 6-dehydrogenase
MKITVVGLGYVGLTNALYLAKDHQIFGYDIDFNKISELQQGQIFLQEKGFAAQLKKSQSRIQFVHEPTDALKQSSVVILAVPTPESPQGGTDLTAIHESFAKIFTDGKKGVLVMIRSTVPPGTQAMLVQQTKKHKREDISIVSVPEFLSLGQAMKDMTSPSRVVVGLDNPSLQRNVQEIFNYPKSVPFLFTTPQSAELIKYAANAF